MDFNVSTCVLDSCEQSKGKAGESRLPACSYIGMYGFSLLVSEINTDMCTLCPSI